MTEAEVTLAGVAALCGVALTLVLLRYLSPSASVVLGAVFGAAVFFVF